jgi:glycosyltransferase involved in cell wall biosynthesis
MRYTIVTETYPPEVNGVALTVQSLERGLRERGHRVDLIRPRQRPDQHRSDHETLTAGLPLPWYPGLRVGLPVIRTLKTTWNLQRPDAIYVATEGPLGWAALRAAHQLGIATASGFHTRYDEYMRNYGLSLLQGSALRWMRYFHNLADATVVPTEELRSFLKSNGFHSVLRLARAVDTDLFHPDRRDHALRAQWRVDRHDTVAIYLGRIAAEKNLELAIRAYRALQLHSPSARFVWVGDGPERSRIEREHPDFIFCGMQHGESLARHFASADLFLFPSKSETYGNVTLEALASGVPTIAFDYGAAHEHLRHGENGAAIIETDDAQSDAQRFIEAARRIAYDIELRTRMRKFARDSVMTLRPQQVAADFDHILGRLHTARYRHERDMVAAETARE